MLDTQHDKHAAASTAAAADTGSTDIDTNDAASTDIDTHIDDIDAGNDTDREQRNKLVTWIIVGVSAALLGAAVAVILLALMQVDQGDPAATTESTPAAIAEANGAADDPTAPSAEAYQRIFEEYSQRVANLGPAATEAELRALSDDAVNQMGMHLETTSQSEAEVNLHREWSFKALNLFLEHVDNVGANLTDE